MKFIKNIMLIFKKIFNKKCDSRMIDVPKELKSDEDKSKFINSLKVNVVENGGKKVETPTCFGDGLGIQNKIDY